MSVHSHGAGLYLGCNCFQCATAQQSIPVFNVSQDSPYKPSHPYMCPICRGSRIVNECLYNESGIGNEKVPCKSCDGKGIVWG